VTPDPFLTGILGKPAFRATAATAAAAAAAGGPIFADIKIPAGDGEEIARLNGLGFRLVDTAVTLEGDANLIRHLAGQGTGSGAARARRAAPEDAAAVEAIAGSSFAFSRFHQDPKIPVAQADLSRARWAGNFFTGQRGDRMVVGEADGEVLGFLQLLGPRDGTLTIDLIAVGQEGRGQGLARAMIGFAAHDGAGITRMVVGTQIANLPSLRLYEGLGFRIAGAAHVFHLHKD